MPALLNTRQSRWGLSVLIGLLSAVAIASSVPSAAGGVSMYSGRPGDIRGMTVLLGFTGLGGVLFARTTSLLVPKPWRIYLDRLEFTFTAMLWVCWTSATMAFSAFILDQGVCANKIHDLPTCPLLTFDLVVLHLLSVSTLTMLVVIISATLAPSYYLSHSTSLSEGSAKIDPEVPDVLVMWELAIASPPPSPVLTATPRTLARSYGTPLPARPLTDSYPQPSNPYATSSSDTTAAETETPSRKRDKFAEGRKWSYIPLGINSIGVIAAASLALHESEYVLNSVFIIVVGILSMVFSIIFLILHFKQRGTKIPEAEQRSFFLRRDRALEVGSAGALFLLWPFAAVMYTLFPPTANRPCDNSSSSLDRPTSMVDAITGILCLLTMTVVCSAWFASWIILARVLSMLFPMPEVGRLPAVPLSRDGGEAQSLLRASSYQPDLPERSQMRWGWMVAGEAFELGDEE